MGYSHIHPTTAEQAGTDLPREPECAAQARQFVRAQLGEEIDEQVLERATLTASELVTNAWQHGEGKIELKIARAADRVRIEVIDEGSGAVPQIREEAADGMGGWGLRIVDQLALRWGCFEGTTHVWAEIGL